MKKLSRLPLSKCEQRGLQRLQARLLREYRALSEKDRAAQISAEKWVQRFRKQRQSRIAAAWEIEMRRVNINVRLAETRRRPMNADEGVGSGRGRPLNIHLSPCTRYKSDMA